MDDLGADPLSVLGDELKRLLAMKRWGVDALARRAGLGRTVVSRALNARELPTIRTLTLLAGALGTDVAPLLALRKAADATIAANDSDKPPHGLSSRKVNADASLPPGTAELRVRRAVLDTTGKIVFELAGYCCCGEDLPPTKNERHGPAKKISLAEQVRPGGERPSRILRRMKDWSRTKFELLDWLAKIRKQHDDDLRLVIWDDSGFDIPWELLWIGPDRATGQSGGWLGTLACVTRWATFQSAQGQIPYRSGRCEGEVIAYVSSEMAADMEQLRGTAVRSTATFGELLSELARPGPGIALVYVALHGSFSSTSSEVSLGGVSLDEISSALLRRINDSRCAVFVNASDSGRLFDDHEYNDGVIRGFAEFFLRSGATGFIGTSGAVDVKHASEVAAYLMSRFREDPGCPVSETLRDLRRSVATIDLPLTEGLSREQEWELDRLLLPYIYACMYLFFGSPETTVCTTGTRNDAGI